MKKDLIKFLKKHRANGLGHFSLTTTSDTLIISARDSDVFDQIRLPCKLGFGEAVEGNDDPKLKYQIRELNGEFTIWIWHCEEVGSLWWKRKKHNWRRCCFDGSGPDGFILGRPHNNCCEAFKSLDQAKQKILSWQAKPIYHPVD